MTACSRRPSAAPGACSLPAALSHRRVHPGSPFARGPVDRSSDVHSQNGLLLVERDRGLLRLFGRGSGFNETRANGTPYQVNATRLWRYRDRGRLAGSPRRLPRDPALRLRRALPADFFQHLQPARLWRFRLLLPLRRDSHAVLSDSGQRVGRLGSLEPAAGRRAAGGPRSRRARYACVDRERTFGSGSALTNLQDHQRDSAAYAEAMWVRKAWTPDRRRPHGLVPELRRAAVDLGRVGLVSAAHAAPSGRSARLRSPPGPVAQNRGPLGPVGLRLPRLSRPHSQRNSTAPPRWGNKLTEPNGALVSERATGWKPDLPPRVDGAASAPATSSPRSTALSPPSPSTKPARPSCSNGKIWARLQAAASPWTSRLAPRRWLALDGGYQHARATVTPGRPGPGQLDS